ncbi:copper amine oxidase N-terminal domain-containing protein [Paenibacillus lycopersici]|uniref:Copper amine oxidase N-terminal domain-containing protein n=2 Tax=Paenibacillus lycopersici TaxID=2704462 RepID=A0A6C0FSA8_9BACL|nr:copper amine oxidase N-terminal domain-containing protein [Paenibacillus lycopersici]
MTVIALVAIVVAGCQALNGLDFNAMLKQSLGTTSYESSETVEFKLLLNDGAEAGLSGAEAEIMNLIANVKLSLTDVKTDERKGMSAEGSLDLGAKHIPFALMINNEAAELKLDGAKKPLYLSLTDPEAEAAASTDDEAIMKAGKQIVDAVSGYAIDNLPNPANLSVKPGQETVHGDTVTGMNVHAELKGRELLDWLKGYVDALMADKEGLKSMLSSLLETLQSQAGAIEASPADSLFGSLPKEDEKQEAVNKAADEIADALKQFKDTIAQSEKEDAEEMDALLNDGTYVKGDLFVDGKLDIRKAAIEAAVSLEGVTAPGTVDLGPGNAELQEQSPFKGIWMKVTTDRWNVNGDVQPAQPSKSQPVLDAESLMNMEGYEVLNQFDKGSDVYDLLRNQAHISKQTLVMSPEFSRNAPIITPGGVTIIPLRYAAESFGATVKEEKDGSIRVQDGATNTSLLLKKGSSNAIINGKTVKWTFPMTVVDNKTYVPARDFAKALGAQISWEADEDDFKLLILVREP